MNAPTSSSLFSSLFFWAFVLLADSLDAFVNGILLNALSALQTVSVASDAAVPVIIAAVVAVETYLVDFGITSAALSVVFLLIAAQLLIALITVSVFFCIVLTSPKGSFSAFDCLLALGVFLLESIPFVGALPMWSFFCMLLRRKRLAKFVARHTVAKQPNLESGAA